MADARTWLDRVDARIAAATDAPWGQHDYGRPGMDEPDSIVIHTGVFDWDDVSDQEGQSAVAWMSAWDKQEDHDAEFIARARTDLPAATAALRNVLDLHAPRPGWPQVCAECNRVALGASLRSTWPCATVTAITAALVDA